MTLMKPRAGKRCFGAEVRIAFALRCVAVTDAP